MKYWLLRTVITVALASISSGGASQAQQGNEQNVSPVLAKQTAATRVGATLLVTSSAVSGGNELDEKYTQNGDNMSPPLAWNRGPLGTQSYVVMVEDAGVKRNDPILHWSVYDIPSSVRSLGENTPADVKLTNGAMQGLNERKTAGFIGPKPPAGQTHPYHFEVFALNKKLGLDPAKADRNSLLEAMKGHVIASGDLVGFYTGK